MPFDFIDDIALADVAVEVQAATLEELAADAAEALLQIQIENCGSLRRTEKRSVQITHAQADMLLYRFLQELIFLKDARHLLLLADQITVKKEEHQFAMEANLSGELIDPARHELRVDVKAVTLHRFEVVETGSGWKATIIFDI